MLPRAMNVLLVAQMTQQYARVMLGITATAFCVLHAKSVIPMLQWSKCVKWVV
jgi:hypothetical protein